jgi:hypothetical protein
MVPAIPVFRRLRQKEHEFEASLGYTERPCLKKKKKKNHKQMTTKKR